MRRSSAAVLSFLVLSAGVLGGCATTVNEAGDLQRASLEYVYYRGNPLPPTPGEDELAAAEAAVSAANPWERILLDDLYPGDAELWAYAIRDTDGDGIHDFRVSDYYGRFLEGDMDVDGDGVDNLLDTRPFVADTDLPAEGTAPAAWSAVRLPAGVDAIRQRLLANNGILLVERNADFTPALARAVEDAVTRVYRSVFADGKTLQSLRLIATAESSLLHDDAEEGAGDYAQVFASSRTMEIYRAGIDAAPVIQLGFLVHEIGHNLQFDMDFDAQRRSAIMRENAFAAENFHAFVAGYGWTTLDFTPDPETVITLFRPQYLSPDPYGYLYDGQSPEAWAAWLEAVYDEVGEDDYLSDSRVVDRHIPGDYSLSSPWEWLSDHLIAYVYLAMIDAAEDRCGPEQWETLGQSFQDDVVRAAWPSFRYENARGAPIQQYLAEALPLEPHDVNYLRDTYLGALLSEHCR